MKISEYPYYINKSGFCLPSTLITPQNCGTKLKLNSWLLFTDESKNKNDLFCYVMDNNNNKNTERLTVVLNYSLIFATALDRSNNHMPK